jgi:thiamine kinase-like enzyme
VAAWFDGRSRLNNILLNPYIGDLSKIPEPTIFFDDSMPLVFIHGDISPYNIRLGKDGTVWLLDWDSTGAYPQWLAA